MKKIIILLILAPLASIAQIKDWYATDLSKLGYRHNVITFETAPNNQFASYSSNPFKTIKGGSWEFSTEIFTKNVYFGLNGSFLLDVGTTLFQFKDKQRWYENDDYNLERGELLPVQLAFGTNIGKYVGVYLGGQYQYTTFGITYPNNVSNDRPIYIGGNQRGAGIHVMGAYKFLHFRYSYMHDWIRAAQTFTGMSYTHEFVAHVGLSRMGVFFKINDTFKEMDGGYFPIDRTERTKADLPEDKALLPSERGHQLSYSVGIYLTGLFSGISQAGARALSQTEQGLRDERNKDKRNKIEYKE